MTVRPFTPEDYGSLSAIMSAEQPGAPLTAAQLHKADALRAPHLKFGGVLAEMHGEAVGFVWHTQYADYYQPGKVVLRGAVLRSFRRCGVGSALLSALEVRLKALGITTMQVEVSENDGETLLFLTRRAFGETWRRVAYCLDAERASVDELKPLARKLEEQGITVLTYPQLAADPNRDEKLSALSWRLEQDVPYGEAAVELTPEAFVRERLAPEAVLKDAFFVASRDGVYVGMSSLWRVNERLDTEFTGVLPEHRGQAVARLMKLLGIDYARRHGYREIHTTNDERNAAMRAVNERLGFKRLRTLLRLENTF